MKNRYVRALAVIRMITAFHCVALVLSGIAASVIVWNFWLESGGSVFVLAAEQLVFYSILLFYLFVRHRQTINIPALDHRKEDQLQELEEYAATLAEKYGVQPPEVRIVDDRVTPAIAIMVDLFRRGVVIISAAMLEKMDSKSQKLFVAHEIGHYVCWPGRFVPLVSCFLMSQIRVPFVVMVPALWAAITFNGIAWQVVWLFVLMTVARYGARLISCQQSRMAEYAADMYMLENGDSLQEVRQAFTDIEMLMLEREAHAFSRIFGYRQNAFQRAFRSHPTNPERLKFLQQLASG